MLEIDTHPTQQSSFYFLRSSTSDPGVMVGSEVEADGKMTDARLLKESTDAAKTFA